MPSAAKDTISAIDETVTASTSSTTAASSSSISNSSTAETLADNEKNLETQTHLRSFGRPDVLRERPKILGWTLARWILLVSNILILLYGLFFLAGSIATFAKGYHRAVVIVIANLDILIVTSLASVLCVGTAVVGIIGTRYRDRRLLGIYSLMLWPCFVLITAVGYLAFKDDTWNLKAKLGMQWRHEFTSASREALQDNLHCCGFENPMDHATYFARCWPESLLPGCAYKFYSFESYFLSRTYTVSFAIVPLHILVIIASFLCSNHVDHLFGTRARPPIPYLGKFSDWRDWEREQKRLKEDSVSSLEPVRTRARATGNDTMQKLTPRCS